MIRVRYGRKATANVQLLNEGPMSSLQTVLVETFERVLLTGRACIPLHDIETPFASSSRPLTMQTRRCSVESCRVLQLEPRPAKVKRIEALAEDLVDIALCPSGCGWTARPGQEGIVSKGPASHSVRGLRCIEA